MLIQVSPVAERFRHTQYLTSNSSSTIYHAMSKWVMRYASQLLPQFEEIRAFEIQNHVNFMLISSFRCGADLVY